MGRASKIGISITGVVFTMLIAVGVWWAHFAFWLPHFHEDVQGDLVSGTTKLVLVTRMLPDDKSGITLPVHISFWHSIGIVDGAMDGRLWTFSEHGKQYVEYQANTEMSLTMVYKYANKSS